MLRNQDAEHLSYPSSGAPRVTPEELSAALSAIEARRQADAKTIPLDQAVSELHLDSTPDEIWAEVQAQRAKAGVKEQAAQPRLGQAAQEQIAARPGGRRRRRFFAPLLIFVSLVVWTNHGHLPHFGSLSTPQTAPVLRPLAQEPDGKTVYADDAALIQISEGKSPAQITISENANGNRWPLVKMAGHLYLHGYIANTDSLHPLQGKALDVYNDDNAGGLEGHSTSKITLRVDNTPLQQSGGDSDYSEVTVPNFQPDSLTTLSDWY